MMWIIAASMIVALPVGFLTFTTSDLSVATFGFLSLAFFLGTFQGPLFGTVHSLVLPRMRATASATTLIPVTLIGLGLGPLLLGAASDYLAKLSFREGDYATCGAGSLVEACRAASASGLRYAMLAYLVFLLWAAVHFVLAGRSIRKEVLD